MMSRPDVRREFIPQFQRSFPRLGIVALAAVFLGLSGVSIEAQSGSPNDEAYSQKIREYTTEPFFLTNLVDHLPASTGVPLAGDNPRAHHRRSRNAPT